MWRVEDSLNGKVQGHPFIWFGLRTALPALHGEVLMLEGMAKGRRSAERMGARRWVGMVVMVMPVKSKAVPAGASSPQYAWE